MKKIQTSANERMETQILSVLSSVVIILILLYYYIIQYYQLPYGDDTLSQFKDCYYWYTKSVEWHPEQFLSNLPMIMEEVWNRWWFFQGRITTAFLGPLLSIAGQRVCAVIGSLTYTGIILCIGKLIWGRKDWKQIFLHPAGLLIIALYQYALTATATYMQMWTFVCHYAIPTLLSMLYYIYAEMIMEKRKGNGIHLFLLTILGIMTGAAHELLGAYCIILVFTRWFVLYHRRKTDIRQICVHLGLLSGYAFCVLAPGNFARMGIAHDIARTQTKIGDKLLASINAHLLALGFGSRYPTLIFFILVMAVLVSSFVNKKRIKEIVVDNLELLEICFGSVFIWAVVAPPVPQYGLQLWKAAVIICLFRNIQFNLNFKAVYPLLTVLLISVFVSVNINWCKDLISVTQQRRKEISEAKIEQKQEVIVTSYPPSTANFMTKFNVGNGDIYEGEWDYKFYGIHIIPDGIERHDD